jgi:hypothetical protein
MTAPTFVCPRCALIAPVRDEMRFCPRCGLPGALDAARDTSPLDLTADDGSTVRVLDRIDYGSICSIYRCRRTPAGGGGDAEGICKIARDPRTNDLVANEAAILRRLHGARDAARFAPFLPALAATAQVADADPAAPPRRANVLRFDAHLGSPADDLYSLGEVRAHYRDGLDPRDMAWIWRRLLAVLGFAHADAAVVHGAVLPMHVLIEPREHKLVLIDWCCAAHEPARNRRPLVILTGGFDAWYDPAVRRGAPPVPGLDIAMGARCMIELTGGDAASGRFPASVDPALQRYFDRCLAAGETGRTDPATATADARRLQADFDRLIEVLWGRRRFRVFEMPPRRRS